MSSRTEIRYYRAFEVYTDHAVERLSGTRMQAQILLDEISAAIMPSTVLVTPDQDRVDRLQFLLDSNPPAAFMVVALVDELDRMAAEALPGVKSIAEVETELADIRYAMHRSLANVRAELRGEE